MVSWVHISQKDLLKRTKANGRSLVAQNELVLRRNNGHTKTSNCRVGALVKWLWEETHIPKVVGSNPSAVYWMDMIFFHIDLL